MRTRNFYVYILASKIGGTLYIGVTNDLVRRVAEHRLKLVEGFTGKYNVVRLVYFEQFDDPENAIRREKRLKKWNRAWKIRLIEEHNPNWDDLYPGICGSTIAVVIPREGGVSSILRQFVVNGNVSACWIVRFRGR